MLRERGEASNEPRKAVPIAMLRRAIAAADKTSFEEVQIVVLILLLLFVTLFTTLIGLFRIGPRPGPTIL